MTEKELPPGIRMHHDKYQVRYYDADGKRQARHFARLTDAKTFKRNIDTDRDRGVLVDPRAGRAKLSDYADEWLATKGNVRPRTRINVVGRLENHIKPALGGRSVGNIKPNDVRGFVADLSARDLAPSTVRATYRTLAQIMRTAEIDGLIVRSPCIGVELPAETGSEEMHFLSPEQVAVLADAIDDRYRCAVYSAAYTGMRAGELWALRLPRVNLLKRRLEVMEALSEVRGKLVVGPTKTRNRRTVALPVFLADAIGEHIGRYPSEDGYIFTAPEGGSVRHHNFMRRHFYPAARASGMPGGLRFHDLRHTCAAILTGQGWNPKQIQERLGHASIRTTLDRYGHLFEGHDQELLDKLDAMQKGTRRGPAAL